MMYKSLGFYESYRREKEHAEFLEKLGQKMDDGKNDGNNKDSNNNNTKKRVGYAFEIKVENEMKKLILKKGEDKNLVVKKFCEKYNINEKEKNKKRNKFE